MTIPEHPDLLLQQTQVKQITRGGRQAADDRAIEAMRLAIEIGMSKGEAETIFSDTYKKFVNGKIHHNVNSV